MPLTMVDEVAALVVIDLQKGIVGFPLARPGREMVEKSATLARAFRARGMPVVWVNVTGGAPGRTDFVRPRMAFPDGWAEFVPELGMQPEDIVVTKQRVGAFLGTKLDEVLKERGVTQVFLAGIATTAGVEATARSAYDLGYNVVFVEDAMTDRAAEAHEYSVANLFPKLGEVDSTANVLAALAK